MNRIQTGSLLIIVAVLSLLDHSKLQVLYTFLKITCCTLIMLNYFSGGTTKNTMPCPNGVKYVQRGETISLNCSISSVDASATAWFKQTPGENPLLIASAYHTAQVTYHIGFDKSGRFNAVKDQNNFNLKISNSEPSDSATYYCVITYYSAVALFHCTVLVLKGRYNHLLSISKPKIFYIKTLHLNNYKISVYWFRHGSGESDPGIIFTHGNRSDQCKKSSETVSPTQSCIYKLPKNNLSLSDAGTYYCAVAACGHIFFGDGTKLDFAGKNKHNILFLLLIQINSNFYHTVKGVYNFSYFLHLIFRFLVMFNMLHVFSLSFTQPPSSRRNRTKNSDDQPMYSHVKIRH
ncbi:hypothetical protein AMEX_G11006 [Astyanax mexicanus]|uniref:Ig-like domain-containing protein n=1 Tax=Astyanax mexicanus TaxID=7994 RepID=A0A8T2LZC1_ASTMX|nr:hypothetical protein AMEX_G11006 [Astyanax mexicanus]